MNNHPFDPLPLDLQGAVLILTPCPGTKGVDTALALEQLQAGGADALITLMPDAEMASNAVTDIGQLCAQRGLQWFYLPIEDEHAPAEDFATAWEAQRRTVHQLLDAGRKIAIHCKGGSGRTGLLAAQILVERGLSKSEAMAMVKAVRPNALSLAVHQDYLSGLPVGKPAREKPAPK